MRQQSQVRFGFSLTLADQQLWACISWEMVTTDAIPAGSPSSPGVMAKKEKANRSVHRSTCCYDSLLLPAVKEFNLK